MHYHHKIWSLGSHGGLFPAIDMAKKSLPHGDGCCCTACGYRGKKFRQNSIRLCSTLSYHESRMDKGVMCIYVIAVVSLTFTRKMELARLLHQNLQLSCFALPRMAWMA